MENAEELHAILPKAVGDNVRQARHDKLAGSCDAAGPSHAGVIREPGNDIVNLFYDGEGRVGIICGYVVGNGDKVTLGRNGPFDNHQPPYRPLTIR